MLIHFIKFIHLLITLGLLGGAIYCIALIGSKKFAATHYRHKNIIYVNKIMLVLCLFAMITGTLLVIPKHFTFHTPWIQAAYLLLLCAGLGIFSLILLKKKRILKKGNEPFSRKERAVWQFAYFVLAIVLIGIIHDAVTKTTFVF